ncbi:hypothetical protein [Lelliottia amnigena]|uniref:hypothetical protein n=1 Tax=Lelliottia amnigena TaxID=61646 RepID=UPI001C21FBA1|nr:hypothetical protein [Lelliottia amnigena]QXB24163.1 hypothetical protein I6L76_23140 [Lelliottia amnigena]
MTQPPSLAAAVPAAPLCRAVSCAPRITPLTSRRDVGRNVVSPHAASRHCGVPLLILSGSVSPL